MKSNKFNVVKQYFDGGLWRIARVRAAVVKGWITVKEYKEITGEDYQ